MKRRFEGLHQSDLAGDELPDGLFLVRVDRAQYRWHAQKPYYSVRFSVLEPKQYMGRQITGRVHCTTKGLWKLTWFLHDFSYDNELMGRDEIDDNALVGLRGVVKITHSVAKGASLHNLDAFAPERQWKELSMGAAGDLNCSKVAS